MTHDGTSLWSALRLRAAAGSLSLRYLECVLERVVEKLLPIELSSMFSWLDYAGQLLNRRSPDRNGICLADRSASFYQHVAVSERRYLFDDTRNPIHLAFCKGLSGLVCGLALVVSYVAGIYSLQNTSGQHSSSVFHGAFITAVLPALWVRPFVGKPWWLSSSP